ncbi:hypothetical protein C2G38_2175501 [Gigaspora rosea]|uniref:DUF3504 domain-containing protein n=1 Tax=Gigaspora rosea TaxID=44941 RepID=A0A397VHA0_9GLOM|nr:hypothetical protein C2G38_2175501 [Gigaspora rosea]
MPKQKKFTYTEATIQDLKQLRNSERVKATYNATKTWVKALETFRTNVGYSRKIEDIDNKDILKHQLSKFIVAMKKTDGTSYHTLSFRNCAAALWRHLNEKPMLPKQIDLLNPKAFYLFNETLNGKLKTLALKELGEHNGADSLTLQKVKAILSHPSLQKSTPEGLLKRIFFYNSIFLALRGGEHQTLQINNFIKRHDGGIDAQLFNSKTNQHGLDNPKGQAELINLDFAGRQISNHSGCKTSVQVLKELGYNDSVVMSITRHKTQQGLAAYKRPNTVMQQQGILGFLDALKIGQSDCHKTDCNESYQSANNQKNNPNTPNLTLMNSFVNAKSLLQQQEFATQTNTLPKNIQQKILTESTSANILLTNQINNLNPQERNEILNKFLHSNFQNCTIYLHF